MSVIRRVGTLLLGLLAVVAALLPARNAAAAGPSRQANVPPSYRIKPHDLLEIEVVKLVYRPAYRLESYDVLQIQVTGTLRDQPIDAYYLVEAEGIVNLGPAYGTIRVAGLTVEKAKQAVTDHLLHTLREPQVSVQARTSAQREIGRVHLVRRDGAVNLREYGAVAVSGKTLFGTQLGHPERLRRSFDSPEVFVGIPGCNSKAYYIITEGAGLGDNVVRVPVTGNETLLDAVSQVRGLSQLSTKQIHIARPSPGNAGCADPAGRLGGHQPRRRDDDELPIAPGRPGVRDGNPGSGRQARRESLSYRQAEAARGVAPVPLLTGTAPFAIRKAEVRRTGCQEH